MRSPGMSLLAPSSSLPPFFHLRLPADLFGSLYLSLHVPVCVCCQAGVCCFSPLFCKIPNLISIFVSSCFANPASFLLIYVIGLSQCKIRLSSQPGSEWTSKLKPWPWCILPPAESDFFLFTICCREGGKGEKKKRSGAQRNVCSYLALEKLQSSLRVDNIKLKILRCKKNIFVEH